MANRLKLVQAFNGLSPVHQILVLLLQEPKEDEPHSVKEWFLQATGPQRHIAWQAVVGQEGALDRIQREMRLKHLEAFFQEREQYGALESMKPACQTSKAREEQRLNSDLYTMTRSLKREPLRLGDMKEFQLWKLDILDAWAAMCLPTKDYQSTLNHLIVNRLDTDVQATVIDLLPKSEEEFGKREPTELFQ